MAIHIPKPELKGFVIYNPALAMFSTGGTKPKWKKHGKIWGNIGHLKNHLLAALEGGSRGRDYVIYNTYQGCEIYNIVTDQKHDLDIYEYVTNHAKENYYGRNGYTIIYV